MARVRSWFARPHERPLYVRRNQPWKWRWFVFGAVVLAILAGMVGLGVKHYEPTPPLSPATYQMVYDVCQKKSASAGTFGYCVTRMRSSQLSLVSDSLANLSVKTCAVKFVGVETFTFCANRLASTIAHAKDRTHISDVILDCAAKTDAADSLDICVTDIVN